MPCNGCNDKPAQTRPAAFAPAASKVWLGAAYTADAATRPPAYHDTVLSRSVDVGTGGHSIHVVELAWLDHCREQFPPLQISNQTPSTPSPASVPASIPP
jgi:hypothetical protein